MDDDEPFVSFPQYVMMTMFAPGDNKQHLVETVLRNLWASSEHAHVFAVEFQDATGTFEGVWIGMRPSDWAQWLADQELRLSTAIADTIEEIETELWKEAEGDQQE